MVNQPAPQPKPQPAPASDAPKAAIPVSPDASAGKKQMLNMIIIGVILFFACAGAYLIPDVRNALFGGGGGGAGVAPVVASGEPVWEKPREPMPMGQYTTPVFGKVKAFTQKDPSGGRRGQYYYLFSPRGAANSGEKYPLVVFLHDEKGIADRALSLLSGPMQQALPAYVLVPMAMTGKTWAVPEKYHGQEFAGKDKANFGWSTKKFPTYKQLMPDVMNLVATLISNVPSIDDGRVYVAGCGEGALGVYGALANYADFFAGGVAISGLWSYNDARKLKDSPLLILHGGKDTTVPAAHAQMMGQLIQQVGGTKVIYQGIPDLARNCSDPRLFSPSTWKWLFSNRKPALQAAPSEASMNPDAPPEMMMEMQKPPPPPMMAP